MKPLVAAAAVWGAAQASLICQSQSSANPIAQQYPSDVTGTINGTLALVLIPVSTAKSLVPAQYGLLTAAAQTVFPSTPAGMYPLLLQVVFDHDVQQSGVNIPDFSRMSFYVPFVDRLGDGYSSFRYSLPLLVSPQPVAFLGSLLYGDTYLGFVEPPCDGYASDGADSTFFTGYLAPPDNLTTALGLKPAFDTHFTTAAGNPYPINAFKNLTNQPTFGNHLPVCDNYITLFNSSVTTGANAPVSVEGVVSVTKPFYAEDTIFENVWGYRLDTAFIEKNAVPCEQLKGYSGTGSGD